MGPINLCGPASGGPGDHQHGGYSHDETCLPARPFNLDDERELTSFFGSGIGIASASKHHDENASHDDNCLLGYGCIGLGLDPGDGDKNALSGASSSFQTWCASYFEEPENLGLDTTYATPKRPIYFDPHQRFCPSNPDLPKDGAPAPSPHISCEVISEGDIVSEKDSRICGSQCCGSSGSCSSGASGPCGALLALSLFDSFPRSLFLPFTISLALYCRLLTLDAQTRQRHAESKIAPSHMFPQ